jgi:hypothetical protein
MYKSKDAWNDKGSILEGCKLRQQMSIEDKPLPEAN